MVKVPLDTGSTAELSAYTTLMFSRVLYASGLDLMVTVLPADAAVTALPPTVKLTEPPPLELELMV